MGDRGERAAGRLTLTLIRVALARLVEMRATDVPHLQYLVGRQLFVKLVGAYAKSHFEKSFSNMDAYDDTMTSLRLRVMYLF